jgi:hypothetical protein
MGDGKASMRWTVRVTLFGRRDGEPVAGIGESCRVGDFPSKQQAMEAAASWRTDPTFVWQASAYRGMSDKAKAVWRRNVAADEETP